MQRSSQIPTKIFQGPSVKKYRNVKSPNYHLWMTRTVKTKGMLAFTNTNRPISKKQMSEWILSLRRLNTNHQKKQPTEGGTLWNDSHKKTMKKQMVFLVSFHIMLRMYKHIFITICKLFYSIPPAKDLLYFHYCIWNISYSTLFCRQSHNLKKEKYITMHIIFTYFKVQKWGRIVPLHFLNKQQQLE